MLQDQALRPAEGRHGQERRDEEPERRGPGGNPAQALRALVYRFDTVSYSDFSAKFSDFRQHVRARSRLCRSRFLQAKTKYTFESS